MDNLGLLQSTATVAMSEATEQVTAANLAGNPQLLSPFRFYWQIVSTCAIESARVSEFCVIATSREAAACRSHGRKPMVLQSNVAEVLKGRHERS